MALVQMLWVGGRLSNVERLSIASFLAHGHEVRLFAYEPIEGAPAGIEIVDARAVLAERYLFRDPKGFNEGSFGGFSDGFRYKLLLDRGGLYSDIDVVCLRSLETIERAEYAVALERLPPQPGMPPSPARMNGCFMKAPRGAPVIASCWEAWLAADKATVRWGDVGPALVSRMFMQHQLQDFVLPADAICPVDFWRAHELASRPLADNPASLAVHFWNGMWRHFGLDKDARYPPASAFEALKARYGIA